MTIIDIVTQARELRGTKRLLANAVTYVNTLFRNGMEIFTKDSWIKPEDFEQKFSFTRSAFRTVTGYDHTYFVFDFDTYPEVRLHQITHPRQLRIIRIKAVYQLIEEIIEKDPNFFTYTSGKGGYAIRRVEPAVKKLIFMKKIYDMFDRCPTKDENGKEIPKDKLCPVWKEESDEIPVTCGLWHEYTRKLFQWRKITTEFGVFNMQMAIDLNMMTKAGRQVFRLPYSLYHKFAGHTFICAPIVWEDGKINVDESLKQTDPLHTIVEDYEVPLEIMDIENEEGVVVDIKAMMSEKTRGLPSQFVRLDVPTPEQGLTIQQWAIVNKMEELLIGTHEKTPPCIKNAYTKDLPDEHHSRVVFGRYLLHKGYNPAQIGMFIRFKVNDHEDNTQSNLFQLDRNIHTFITPTPTNQRKLPRCSKMQSRGNTFFCCRPEDAKICGRPYVLEAPTNTRAAKAKRRAIKRKQLIPSQLKEEDGIYGKFEHIVKTVEGMLGNNDATLVKKTTRAGLTTSLIVAATRLKKRLLVLEPTNRIAAQTFPQGMRIARKQYDIKPTGAVLANNPKGCLKLMIKGLQLGVRKANEPTWGMDGVQWLRLPMVLKPRCGDPESGEQPCEFFDNVFPMEGPPVIESEVTSIEGDGDGRCARITVIRNLQRYDIVFATYAKMMATVASDTDTNLVAYSELSDYDVILLDEISTLVDGQPTIIDIAGIQQDGKTRLRTHAIRDNFTTLISNRRSDYPLMENMIETGLNALEEAINNLRMTFVRGGKKTIRVINPLTPDERDEMISQYAAVQYTVEHTNLDLSLLATFLLTLGDDEWYLTAITNLYNYTNIKMITKPEIILLRRFLRYMQRKGKKIMITDASLPPMSMEALLRLKNVKIINLGDPRDTNALSLLIPDTKKVNVTDLVLKQRKGNEGKPLNKEKIGKLVEFLLQVIERHGTGDVTLIMPNSGEIYGEVSARIKAVHPALPKDGGVKLTYYRSDLTVGVHSKRRTMVVVCKPLPPEDSFDWLATHYAMDQDDQDNITGISNMFREHSAKQSFYQTIGRAKDPSAAVPSVIYCYGIKIKSVHQLLRDYDPPVVLTKVSTDTSLKLNIGSHWRRTGELLDTTIVAAINYVEKKGRVKATAMQGILNKYHFESFMKNLSIFGIEYEKSTGYLYLNQ